MTTLMRCSAVLAVMAGAVGCGRLPATHYYMIDVHPPVRRSDPTPGAPPLPAGGQSIGVQSFHVDPPYDQDRIVYRTDDATPEVAFYTYHRWAVSLSRMLPGAVAAGLEGVSGVARIEPVAPGRTYDAILEGRLRRLEEIDRPGEQTVRVSLSLSLHLADGTPVWTDELEDAMTVSTDTVGDLVSAMTATLATELAGARPGLAAALADLEP
ncbi:MAG: ABC-type transport auxiliary lipoprotein family protein [Acidobacteriota bacterium]